MYVGELRAMGLEPGEDLPEVAWVPRSSVRRTVETGEVSEEDKRQRLFPNITIKFHFDEPWQWITVNGTVKI